MGCLSNKPKKIFQNNSGTIIKFQKTTKAMTRDESILSLYRLEETLLRLPYCKILKAIHLPSKLLRAIKVVNIKIRDSEFLNEKQLRLEVKTLASLDHPSILKVFDILHDEVKVFIIMEYWEGGLLLDKIKEKGHLSEKIAGKIITQILSGVRYCHDRKVIHRDLNPKLVLMMDHNDNEKISIKLGEFGSSAFLDPEHRFEGKFDNSVYVAPEVCTENYDEKCDLWSVGTILYVLLTGRTPFAADLSEDCERSEKLKPLNLAPLYSLEISNSAIDLVKKLLDIDPKTRISAQEALEHPWFQELATNSEKFTRNLNETLNNLAVYHSKSKAIDAIQSFIAKQVITHNETKDMIEVFKAIDSDWDGKISRTELKKYYIKNMPAKEAEQIVKEIFQYSDSDNSGFIEFSEFIKSSMCRNNLISKQNLEAAFQMLDSDNSGKISVRELRSMLDGTSLSGDKKWMKLIKTADKNNDGEIDMKEFCDLIISHN